MAVTLNGKVQEAKQETPLPSADFPLYTESDIYGMGYFCELALASCPVWLKTLMVFRPWLI